MELTVNPQHTYSNGQILSVYMGLTMNSFLAFFSARSVDTPIEEWIEERHNVECLCTLTVSFHNLGEFSFHVTCHQTARRLLEVLQNIRIFANRLQSVGCGAFLHESLNEVRVIPVEFA